MPSVWTTYIATDDLDATAAKVTAAAGQLLMPPFDVTTAGRMTVFSDPAGAAAGLWQAKEHTGAGVFNQPGAYCWNELHTRNYEAAKTFFAEVFGYGYTAMSPTGQDEGYVTFAMPGSADPAGGIADDTRMGGPEDVPPHWLTWFAVEDTDTAAVAVASLGGQVMIPPATAPSAAWLSSRAPKARPLASLPSLPVPDRHRFRGSPSPRSIPRNHLASCA
jgi:predicted enzyme related to lactoylglutathione lyase